MTNLPPEHVRKAFGVSGEPIQLGRAWDRGWRYGSTVLSPVVDSAQALWSAKVRQTLDVDGVGVVKQMRTPDGRHFLGGWQARHWVDGSLQSRPDETVVLAGRVEAALKEIPRPQFLIAAHGDFAVCDRAVWSKDADSAISVLADLLNPEDIPRADAANALTTAGKLLQLVGQLSDSEQSVQDNQITHTDVVGTLLYDADGDAFLTDVAPSWRPVGWSSALAAVDALTMTGADEDLLQRFDHLPSWAVLVSRAMCYRLCLHAVRKDSQPGAWRGLARASSLVEALARKSDSK